VRSPERERGPRIITPYRRKAGQALPLWQRQLNAAIASLRAKVEHPFRIVKRQFGYTKVRYRGLAKNHSQITTLFALANLYRARRALLAAG
jgi:IS5 family transposase